MAKLLLSVMPLLTRADKLTFSQGSGACGATWTLEVVGEMLHVEADCPDTKWCGLGFNDQRPKMDGTDVFTFGHHPGVDLSDCRQTPACGTACGSACGTACGSACGTTSYCSAGCGKAGKRRLGTQRPEPFLPRVRNLQLSLPHFSAPQAPKRLDRVGGIVGIALNSVLLVHEHPGEGMTWVLDNCGGHGDTFGHYHYHAPPLCLLRSLGLKAPKGSWWQTDPGAWDVDGAEVQVGWALDGAKIMGPYRGGKRVVRSELDECHGSMDGATGEYRYFMVLEPPFMPPCLRGQLGNVSGYRNETQGAPCSQRDRTAEVLAEALDASGARRLRGQGCPGHAVFQEVKTGRPFAKKLRGAFVRQLNTCGACGGCGVFLGTCPGGACGACGGACGACGASCGGCGACGACGACSASCGACGTSCGACGSSCGACGTSCGTTCGACGTSCGTTTTSGTSCGACGACGTSCGACGACGTSCGACGACGTSCGACGACGTSCGACGTSCGACGACGTSCGACGASCGACGACGAGCGAYKCLGQMFCGRSLTQMNKGVALSLSQCNLNGYSIQIDQKQDLTDVSYVFENGRMKASAKRALNTGDATDLVLGANMPYYVIMSLGGNNPTVNVGYHGTSSSQTLVCLSTLSQTYECKAPADWENVAPAIPAGQDSEEASSAAPAAASGLLAALLAMAAMS